MLESLKNLVGLGFTTRIQLRLSGPVQSVFPEKSVALRLQQPAQGLRHTALGEVFVTESESRARAPNIGGVFCRKGRELLIGAGRTVAKITSKLGKFFERCTVFGSLHGNLRRRGFRLATVAAGRRRGLFRFVLVLGGPRKEVKGAAQ